jgi:molecular chaperone GrpE
VDGVRVGERGGDEPGGVGASASDDPRSRVELLAALAEAETARDEYLDDLRRAQAEFANYRKRAMREGAEQREQGTIDVLGKLVDVVDDFELAVLASENAQDVESLRRGVEMVYGKLIDTLRSYGLERIGQEGVPFDPELHAATLRNIEMKFGRVDASATVLAALKESAQRPMQHRWSAGPAT